MTAVASSPIAVASSFTTVVSTLAGAASSPRNVLSPSWGAKALHFDRGWLRCSKCNVFPPRWGDKTLHFGGGGWGHGATVPGGGARVVRSVSWLARGCVARGSAL